MPGDGEIVAYADDIALIAKSPVTYKVGELLEEAADTIVGWLEVIGIELALEKTELLLPTRKCMYNKLQVTIRAHTVKSYSPQRKVSMHPARPDDQFQDPRSSSRGKG